MWTYMHEVFPQSNHRLSCRIHLIVLIFRGCNNGRCARPNVCECNAGWSLDSTGVNCVPGCSRPCLNGVCSASDTCSCHRGYVLDPVDPFKWVQFIVNKVWNLYNNFRIRCIAFCPNGCPNGVCSAPNLCLCNVGFVKDRSVKGSQSCIPRQWNLTIFFYQLTTNMNIWVDFWL